MKSIFVSVSICIVCLVVVSFAGCLGTNPVKPPTLTPSPSTVQTLEVVVNASNAEQSVVGSNNKFAINLFTNLYKDPNFAKTNIFFSPFSISSALAITYEGARGITANEIQSVFFLQKDDAIRRQGFETIYTDINKGNSRYILKTANALWVEKSYPFLSDYTHTAQVYYNANTTNLDFKNMPEDSRITINTWVKDQTNNQIKDLIPENMINPSTRLVITNAIYFKGTWVKKFEKSLTTLHDFFVEPDNIVHVQMMERTDRDSVFNYTETDNLQVLEMPYASDGGKTLSMVILLPKGDKLSAIENTLDLQQISVLRKGLVSKRIDVYFPKFKLETKYSLSKTLGAMGMPTAFTDSANFSGIDGMNNLYIGDVIHQAFIDVNEEGTEAAAATGVIIGVGAVQPEQRPPVFRADHPFIFLIQDTETGNILFMGHVNNPNG